MKTDNLRTVKLSEIIDLPIHPVADILPILEKSVGDESKKNTVTLAELADNIRKNGLQEPIVLFTVFDDVLGANNTMILDGRNRRLACQMAAKTDKVDLDDFEVQVLDFIGTEDEADEFVFVKGLNRRDLTASQRAISAAMFEYDCPEAFARMKAKAEAAMLSTLIQNRDSAEPNLAQREERESDVNYMLAKAFNVSTGYVKDARRKLADERKARSEAERHAAEAERLEELAKATSLEIEEARAEGADSAKIWEVAQTQNTVIQAAAEEREKAAELAQQASAKAVEIQKIHKKQANLRQSVKEPKEQSEDPIKQLRTRINSSMTNLKQTVTELAKISGQGVDDYNFVARKVSEFITHFEGEFGMQADN